MSTVTSSHSVDHSQSHPVGDFGSLQGKAQAGDARFSTYTTAGQTSTLYSQGPGSPMSPRRFRDSVHLIEPSNRRPPQRFDPLIMKLPVVLASPLSMFILGVGLEVLASLSKAQGGFRLPGVRISTVFGDVSTQFLASFLPTLIIIPNAILWRELDWMLRSYQPFVVLSQGGAKAEETILLDYIELGPLLAIPRAMKYKHRIILLSSLTAVFTYLFQPLTGSIFQVRQTPETRSWDTTRSETIGLSPEIGNLQGFLAAAGYVDAHVTHDLEEPEFIRSITGWATGKFDFPQEPGLNATVSAVTNGIRTNVNCDNPAEPPVVTRSASRVTLASRSLQGCSHTTTFNVTADSDIFYGVDAVVCPDSPSDMIIEHRPVMFWFYRTVDGGVGDARTVFCAPNLEGSEVEVVASVDTGRILALNRLSDQVPFNDVLNGDNAGKAMNGVVFAESDNSFIQTRAIATNLLVPSAILRHIDKQEGGRDAVFARPNGVLDSTVEVYRLHLTMASKTNYFVPGEVTLNGQVVEIVPRLWVDPFPAHFLAALLILTGFIGIFLHVINRKQRKKVHLACVPGTIAGTVSLASHSGWPQLLTPYDNLYDMEQKLSSLRFSLDKRTGAIIADDDGSSTPDERSQDAEVRMSLMNTKIEVSPNPESSSFAAFQTAAGVEPWKEKNKWKLFRKRDSSGSS